MDESESNKPFIVYNSFSKVLNGLQKENLYTINMKASVDSIIGIYTSLGVVDAHAENSSNRDLRTKSVSERIDVANIVEDLSPAFCSDLARQILKDVISSTIAGNLIPEQQLLRITDLNLNEKDKINLSFVLSFCKYISGDSQYMTKTSASDCYSSYTNAIARAKAEALVVGLSGFIGSPVGGIVTCVVATVTYELAVDAAEEAYTDCMKTAK